MSSMGRLDSPLLKDIDQKLDSGDLTAAQQLLARAGENGEDPLSTSYLVARMLFLRGRLDSAGVAERMRELLVTDPGFPQALAMMKSAEAGGLSKLWSFAEWVRVHGMPQPSLPPEEKSKAADAPIAATRRPHPPSDAIDVAADDNPVPPTRRPNPPSDAPAVDATPKDSTLPPRAPTPVPQASGLDNSSAPPQPPTIPPMTGSLPSQSSIPALGSSPPSTASAPPRPPTVPPASKPPEPPDLELVSQPPSVPDLDVRPSNPPGLLVSSGPPKEPGPEAAPHIPSLELEVPEVPKKSAHTSGPHVEVGEALTESQAVAGLDDEEPKRTGDSDDVRFESSGPPRLDPSAPAERKNRDSHGRPAIQRYPTIPRAAAVPHFSDRPYAPSYVPDKRKSSNAIPAANSAAGLPRGAGRYSERPSGPDAVTTRSSRPPPPSSAPDARKSSPREGDPRVEPQSDEKGRSPRETPTRPEPIRSGAPPHSTSDAVPSMVEIATLIDDGQFEDAVAALEHPEQSKSPDHVLLHSRALDGAGRRREATRVLDELGSAPLLDPEVRSQCARQYVDIGEMAAAFEQAKIAYQEDPEPDLVKLTFAWSAVRWARREPSRELVEAAGDALSAMGEIGGQYAALALGLRACVASELGEPDRGIAIARRALGIDNGAADALAALALGAAKLERHDEACKAWLTLLDRAYEEADALSEPLEALGVDLASLVPGSAELNVQASPGTPWEDDEEELVLASSTERMAALEALASERLAQVAKQSGDVELPIVATVAANFMTTAPIFRHFAPYDLSLWSVQRIEAVLLTAAGQKGAGIRSSSPGLMKLLGAYLGEALRQAFNAQWNGGLHEPRAARVRGQTVWSPFELVEQRLQLGPDIPLPNAARIAVSQPGSDAWTHSISIPVAPPAPWDPDSWPETTKLAGIGQKLNESMVGDYCRRIDKPLDFTLASFKGLDAYLDIVAHPAAPTEEDPPWAARVASLVGAYIGETFRKVYGGEWVDLPIEGAERYLFELVGGRETSPISYVFDRLVVRDVKTLADYAEEIALAMRK